MLDHLGIIPLCNQGRSEVVAIYPGIPRNSQEFPEIPRNTGTLFSDNPKISKVDSHKLLGTLVPQSSVWNKPSTELPSRLPSDSRAKHQCHLSGHKWPSGCERLKRHEATPGGRWGPGHHVQKFGSRQHSPGEKTDLAAKNAAKNKKKLKKSDLYAKTWSCEAWRVCWRWECEANKPSHSPSTSNHLGVFQIMPLPGVYPIINPIGDGYHWVCHISSDDFVNFRLASHVLPGLTMWICFGTWHRQWSHCPYCIGIIGTY